MKELLTALWSNLKVALLEAAHSKKFAMTVLGLLVILGDGLLKLVGVSVPQEHLYLVIGTLISYVLGQGWADAGKEAGKLPPK